MGFSTIVFYILIGLLSLDLMVIIHEVGHLVMAKLNHIEVDYLQLGFGPEIKSFGKYNPKISFASVPFGGMCKMDNLSLYSAHPFRRILTYLSGPLANVLCAIVFFCIYLLINNTPFAESLIMSVKQCWYETEMFYDSLTLLVTGQAKLSEILSGAFIASKNIGMLTVNGFESSFMAGINIMLYLFASVSLSLGVANLLPIPALDGALILISFVEMITKRTFSERFYLILQIIGLAIILVIIPIVRLFW